MKNYLRKVLLFLPLLLANCENDSFNANQGISPEEPSFLDRAKLNFTLKGFQDPGDIQIKELEILWDQPNSFEVEGRTWHEISVQQKKKFFLEDGEITNISYVLLFVEKEDGSPMYYFTKILSQNGQEYSSYANLQQGYFTGMVQMYDLNGDVLVLQYLRKGELINTTIDIENKNPAILPIASRCTERIASRECTSTNDCVPPTTGGGSCGGTSGGSYVWTYLGSSYTLWYLDRGGYYEYSHREDHGSRFGWVWVPSSGTTSSPQDSWSYYKYWGEGGAYLSNEPSNITPTHINVASVKNPCVKKLLAKLRYRDINKLVTPNIGQIQGANHLSQTILDMFHNSPDYHLNFKIADATTASGKKRNAYTTPRRNVPSTGQWTFDIVLDKNFVKNATRLAIARTIIHESLHAYLYYTTQTYSSSSFSQLFYNYLSSKGYTTNEAQHNMMTQFADAIGYSLSIYDLNQHGQSYYNNLAWSGEMLSTSAFSSLSSTRQNSIKNANRNEGNAVYSATGSAKGIKCP